MESKNGGYGEKHSMSKVFKKGYGMHSHAITGDLATFSNLCHIKGFAYPDGRIVGRSSIQKI